MTAPLNAWSAALADLSRQFEEMQAENADLRRRIKTLEAANNRLRWTRTHFPAWEDLPAEMRKELTKWEGGTFSHTSKPELIWQEIRDAFQWAAERVRVPA